MRLSRLLRVVVINEGSPLRIRGFEPASKGYAFLTGGIAVAVGPDARSG